MARLYLVCRNHQAMPSDAISTFTKTREDNTFLVLLNSWCCQIVLNITLFVHKSKSFDNGKNVCWLAFKLNWENQNKLNWENQKCALPLDHQGTQHNIQVCQYPQVTFSSKHNPIVPWTIAGVVVVSTKMSFPHLYSLLICKTG
jgi:hypothetical protein